MSDRLALLATWMAEPEGEHLEFKEAKTSFEFEELVKYCVALANEGGGRFVLGVTDQRPRLVVGSRAFQSLDRTKGGLSQRRPSALMPTRSHTLMAASWCSRSPPARSGCRFSTRAPTGCAAGMDSCP